MEPCGSSGYGKSFLVMADDEDHIYHTGQVAGIEWSSRKRLLYLPKHPTMYSTNPEQWSKLIFYTVSSIPFANASTLRLFLITVSEYSQDELQARLCLPTRYKKRTFTSLFIPLRTQDQRVVSFRTPLHLPSVRLVVLSWKKPNLSPKSICTKILVPFQIRFTTVDKYLRMPTTTFRPPTGRQHCIEISYAKNCGVYPWHEQSSTRYVMLMWS